MEMSFFQLASWRLSDGAVWRKYFLSPIYVRLRTSYDFDDVVVVSRAFPACLQLMVLRYQSIMRTLRLEMVVSKLFLNEIALGLLIKKKKRNVILHFCWSIICNSSAGKKWNVLYSRLWVIPPLNLVIFPS